MVQLMSAQLALRREGRLAGLALERRTTFVNQHMLFEMKGAYERFPANVTLVWPLLIMVERVFFETALGGERLNADVTGESRLATLGFNVI